MGSLTLLNLVKQATGEMGVQQPSTVISNTTLYVIQLLNLANGLGQNLAREYNWQGFDKEYRFTTVFYTYTGTLTPNSTTVSNLSSTTGLTSTPTYFTVTGSGINQDTTLVSVNSGASTCVLSQLPNVTSVTNTVTLNFCQTQYAMPSDYDRLIDRTDWSKTQHWEMLGPETAQQWQWLKSGFISTGPRLRYRILGSTFQIFPPQTTALYLGFEYMSNQWVGTAANTALTLASYTADTDVSVFPDSLMITGLKWRWATEKANNAENEYKAAYMRQLDIAISADGGSKTLQMAPSVSQLLLSQTNIPDSGFGTP